MFEKLVEAVNSPRGPYTVCESLSDVVIFRIRTIIFILTLCNDIKYEAFDSGAKLFDFNPGDALLPTSPTLPSQSINQSWLVYVPVNAIHFYRPTFYGTNQDVTINWCPTLTSRISAVTARIEISRSFIASHREDFMILCEISGSSNLFCRSSECRCLNLNKREWCCIDEIHLPFALITLLQISTHRICACLSSRSGEKTRYIVM